MLVKRILEKREEKKTQRARLEGAKQKHAEWIEWAKEISLSQTPLKTLKIIRFV